MSGTYVDWPPEGSGSGGVVNGSLTAVYTVGPLDGAPASPNGASIGTSTLFLQTATTVNPGLVSSGSQTFAGVKTFQQPVTLSANGSASYLAGGLYFDNVSQSPTFLNSISSISLQIGQENWIRVRNNSGSTINNGRAVYITGAISGQDLPTIGLAIATTTSTSALVGVATHDIANNGEGFVTSAGVVHGIDTSAYSAGQRVWLSTASAGFFQVTDPAPPNFSVFVGYVLDVGSTTGSLLLTIIRVGSSGVPFKNPMTLAGQLIVSSGAGVAAVVTYGQGVLTTSSGSYVPTWSRAVPVTMGTFDAAAASANGAVLGTNSLFLQSASTTNPGLVSSNNQSFAGVKTFTSQTVLTNTLSSGDGLYSIGTSSNASGRRFANLYLSNNWYIGNFPASAGSSYIVCGLTQGPGPSPAQIWYAGTGNAYGIGNDGTDQFLYDVGLNSKFVRFGRNTFRVEGAATNLPYFVASISAVLVNRVPFQMAGSTSGTLSLSAHDDSTTYSMKMPQSQGSNSWVMQNDGSGNLSWTPVVTNPMSATGDLIVGSASGSPTKLALGAAGTVLRSGGASSLGVKWEYPSGGVLAKSADYTVGTSDGSFSLSSSSYTLVLPSAVGITGQSFRFCNVNAISNFGVITIATVGSQTFTDSGETSTTLNTGGEAIDIETLNSATWTIFNRKIPSAKTIYVPSVTGMNQIGTNTIYWQRQGTDIRIFGSFNVGSVTTVTASFGLPPSLTTDFTFFKQYGFVLQDTNTGAAIKLYSAISSGNSGATSTQFCFSFPNTGSAVSPLTPGTGAAVFVSNAYYTIDAIIPIVGWKA